MQVNSKLCTRGEVIHLYIQDVKFRASLGEETHYLRPLFQLSSHSYVTVGCALICHPRKMSLELSGWKALKGTLPHTLAHRRGNWGQRGDKTFRYSLFMTWVTWKYTCFRNGMNFFMLSQDCNFLLVKTTHLVVWVAQSCPTLCDPMDCSWPGSSVHWHRQEYWNG